MIIGPGPGAATGPAATNCLPGPRFPPSPSLPEPVILWVSVCHGLAEPGTDPGQWTESGSDRHVRDSEPAGGGPGARARQLPISHSDQHTGR